MVGGAYWKGETGRKLGMITQSAVNHNKNKNHGDQTSTKVFSVAVVLACLASVSARVRWETLATQATVVHVENYLGRNHHICLEGTLRYVDLISVASLS